MALNELINQVVDVQIRNVTSNTYSRDLNTVLILAGEAINVFDTDEQYRVYQDSGSMLEDGFSTDSYEYNAARLLFIQEIRPTRVVVGSVDGDSEVDYIEAFEKMLMIPQGWLWLISDTRDVDTQIQLAYLVEENDKMYLAATHDEGVLDAQDDTDLSSRIKTLQLSHTACWYDGELL